MELDGNRIFSVECVEVLHKLTNLAEVSFKDNPVCVHKHLTEMVLNVVPSIEVVNQESLKEAGARYKDELDKLRRSVQGLGERHIEEAAEVDPKFRAKLLAEEEAASPGKKLLPLDSIFHLVKKDEENTEKMF